MLVHALRRKVLFRELKTDIGKVSPDQERVMSYLTLAGLDVGIWRPSDFDSGRILRELAS